MKKLKKILIVTGATALVLVVALAVHLAMVIKPLPNSSLQLSRIDFEQPLNSEQAHEVVAEIKQIDGVKFTHVNEKDGILVFSHDLNVANGAEIYAQFAAVCALPSQRFVTTAQNSMEGCPINPNNTFLEHFTSGIKTLFN